MEDDAVIANRLLTTLQKEGFEVDAVQDGESGLRLGLEGGYALILLDVMMPKRDGFQVIEELRRRRRTTPVLMLTAKDAVTDRVQGLDLGADDYLVKPFDFAELLARIRALLRREKSNKEGVLHVADLEIDPKHRTVRRGEEPLNLTPREFELLEALARRPGRVLTREVITEQIWGDSDSLSNTVNFHVTGLRKKIDQGRDKSLIRTVHGFGYTLEEGG